MDDNAPQEAQQNLMDPQNFLSQLIQLVQQAQFQAQQGEDPLHDLTQVDPYAGDALDLRSRNDTSLYQQGASKLDVVFTGKPTEAYDWIKALTNRAKKCCWYSDKHGILMIPKQDGKSYDLLKDYGVVTIEDVKALYEARKESGSQRAKQNAKMMYECILASVSASVQNAFPDDLAEDGPTAFMVIIGRTRTTSFAHSVSTREALRTLNPAKFKYEIPVINDELRRLLTELQASTKAQVPTSEKLWHTLSTYEKIKSPKEWSDYIQYVQNTDTLKEDYDCNVLMSDAETKYALLNQKGLWKPSDRAPEQDFLAMFIKSLGVTTKGSGHNNQTQSGTGSSSSRRNNRNRRSGNSNREKSQRARERPPFDKEPGKSGDTREWNKKTWYYCPKEHPGCGSHWVLHKPEDHKAGTTSTASKDKAKASTQGNNNKTSKGNNNDLVIDRDKLRTAFQALEAQGADLHTAATAVLGGLISNDEE